MNVLPATWCKVQSIQRSLPIACLGDLGDGKVVRSVAQTRNSPVDHCTVWVRCLQRDLLLIKVKHETVVLQRISRRWKSAQGDIDTWTDKGSVHTARRPRELHRQRAKTGDLTHVAVETALQ